MHYYYFYSTIIDIYYYYELREIKIIDAIIVPNESF